MTKKSKSYKYRKNGLVFSWWGGPYIEISQDGSEIPFDVYNVWDYEKDVPTIERSMLGLVAFIDERLDEGEDY